MPITVNRTAIAVIALCCALTGCLSVAHDSRYRSLRNVEGQDVNRDVVVGKTSRSALIEHLGTPDADWLTNDGQEILRWDNTRERRTHVRLFPLLSVHLAKEDTVRYFFAITNGTVQRNWQEPAAE